jgi:hypothetical protein
MTPFTIPTAWSGFTHVSISKIITLGAPTKNQPLSLGGGMPTSTNRSYWPVGGGALAMQPGWFPGHETALIYINMGLGEVPENMSHTVLGPFQITGPSNNPYPGTFCLPQVPLPANISVKPGDLATIQVVEAAKHGAGLFNVCSTSHKPGYSHYCVLTSIHAVR